MKINLPILVLAFVVFSFPAFAEETEQPFRWKIQKNETIKYETIIKSSSIMPVPQEEAPGGRSKEQLQKDLKEHFGENYKKGYLSFQGTLNTITALREISDNQINLKTVIVDEKATADRVFINGAGLKKGLVTANLYLDGAGNLIALKDDGKQPPAHLDSNQSTLLQNLLLAMPEKIKKPGDTEKLEIPCVSYQGFSIEKHKKTGALKFEKIEKNKINQEIAVLSYNYNERIEVRDTPEPDYSKIQTTICQYKGHGRFNLTTGRWEYIEGKLKIAARKDQAIEMNRQDFITTSSYETIQIKTTDKTPSKEITQEEYFKALQAANPEIFDDIQESPVKQGKNPHDKSP